MEKPVKPAEFAENQLLNAILSNQYSPGDALPAERVLAQSLGVTRPTLREALQRLAREGWIIISHGKASRVNDYLNNGGLAILGTLARQGTGLSPQMVGHLLEVRASLLPDIAQKVADTRPDELISLIPEAGGLPGDPDRFSSLDWDLQMGMVKLSGNPVFAMIFNDFTPLYQTLGPVYFRGQKARDASQNYYRELKREMGSGEKNIAPIVARAMDRSREIWREIRWEIQ